MTLMVILLSLSACCLPPTPDLYLPSSPPPTAPLGCSGKGARKASLYHFLNGFRGKSKPGGTKTSPSSGSAPRDSTHPPLPPGPEVAPPTPSADPLRAEVVGWSKRYVSKNWFVQRKATRANNVEGFTLTADRTVVSMMKSATGLRLRL